MDVSLRALKPLSYPRGTYNTRRLLPGDYFTASAKDAKILVAIGKAKEDREIGTLPPPPAGLTRKLRDPLDHDGDGEKGGSKTPDGDKEALNKLRADYTQLLGKRPFPGWDEAELQRRIDEALSS